MTTHESKEITIIVNGREKTLDKGKISYNEVIELAFGTIEIGPEVVYTITYSKGNKDDKGSMVSGDVVNLKQGMVFNVTRTDRS